MPLLEAIAFDRPVLASAVAGIPEIITSDEMGVLINPQDASDIARAVIQLIDDPPRFRSLGTHARQRIEEAFSASTMSRQYATLYSELQYA